MTPGVSNFKIVATRFELATSASRTQRSTKLSHATIYTAVPVFRTATYILYWIFKILQVFFYLFFN